MKLLELFGSIWCAFFGHGDTREVWERSLLHDGWFCSKVCDRCNLPLEGYHGLPPAEVLNQLLRRR